MTPEYFAEQMKEIYKIALDETDAHVCADVLLCTVLRELGYEQGVTIFEKAIKWYD